MLDLALALWIRTVRSRAHFSTQAAFAQALGVSRGAVGNWETGRGKPSMAHAERFAVVTNRPRSEVMARLGYPIGGGEPTTAGPLPEWLDAIQKAVSTGVADGIAQALEQLRDEGLLGQPGRPGGQSPRRRSA